VCIVPITQGFSNSDAKGNNQEPRAVEGGTKRDGGWSPVSGWTTSVTRRLFKSFYQISKTRTHMVHFRPNNVRTPRTNTEANSRARILRCAFKAEQDETKRMG